MRKAPSSITRRSEPSQLTDQSGGTGEWRRKLFPTQHSRYLGLKHLKHARRIPSVRVGACRPSSLIHISPQADVTARSCIRKTGKSYQTLIKCRILLEARLFNPHPSSYHSIVIPAMPRPKDEPNKNASSNAKRCHSTQNPGHTVNCNRRQWNHRRNFEEKVKVAVVKYWIGNCRRIIAS